MLSDLRNLPDIFKKIKFTLGKPILPFQQLMSCLPPASSSLLPMPFRYLMTSPDSPIIQFYPVNFEVDMNGKKNPWESINLLPFIDIDLLLDTIAKYVPNDKLTSAEKQRNRVGEIFSYAYDMTATETVEAPHKGIGMTDIVKCHSRVTILPQYQSFGVSFRPELIPGTEIPYPGFPSLNVLPIADTELVRIGVKVFGFPSKSSTMVLRLRQLQQTVATGALADMLLDKSIFINWPMMHEAKVTAISDNTTEIRLVKGKKKVKEWNNMEESRWIAKSEEMTQNYLVGTNIPGSGGVDIGQVNIRLRLLPLQGMKTSPVNGSTKKLFGKEEAEVPFQLALMQPPARDRRFIERGPMSLQDRFPPECNVVLTKGKYRGCVGQVVGVTDDKKLAVKVLTLPPEVPFGLALARSVYESYISSADAARILKINALLFGRITSSIIFAQGGYDLGLNLKSQGGLCVAGYTRQKRYGTANGCGKPTDEKKAWDSGDSLLVVGSSRAVGNNDDTYEERIQWEYTPKAIRLVNEYRQKFPQLFNALAKLPTEKKYDANQVFGPNGAEWLAVIREWLNNVDSAKVPRTPITTDTMSHEAVVAVERAAYLRNFAVKKQGFPKKSTIKIPGSALYRENSTGPTDVMLASDHNDNKAPELGDRVVNLCASGIPFGSRGTVVGIHKATTGCVEVVMDEEFVGGTNLQGLCSNFRGKLAVWAHLMRITLENNQGMVDQLVPMGSGKANVSRILSDIETQVNSGISATPLALPSEEAAVKLTTSLISTPIRQSSSDRIIAVSSGKSRAESTGRDKQAGWREAKGPPENGIGFKPRKGKNGINRWKNFVRGTPAAAAVSAARTSSKASELKAILGVTSSPASNLKSLLGVTPEGARATPSTTIVPPPPTQKSIASAAGLKAVLGVDAPGVAPAPVLPPVQNVVTHAPPPPSSAADKLMQLMVERQHLPHSLPPPQSEVTAFNFSYTEEGKETLELPKVSMGHPIMPPQPMGVNFPLPLPAVPMVVPVGYLQQPLTPNAVGHPGVPPVGMVPQPTPYSKGLAMVSDEGFPLSGSPSPNNGTI
jgi:hypothetical protein